MRILCLTSRLPYPPDRGDRLRAFHILRHLARDHELTLLSFVSDGKQLRHVEALRSLCREVVVVRQGPLRAGFAVASGLWRDRPLQSLYYRSAVMDRAVRSQIATRSFDAAYIHLFRMAQYLEDRNELYRVVDLTDLISLEIARSRPHRSLPWRLLYRYEQARIMAYERRLATSFDECWLIAGAERDQLQTDCPSANLQVIPNGVDRTAFTPGPHPRNEAKLVFVGHLRVPHNIDAAVYLASEILPRVRRALPACTLRIVGADPAPRVQALAADPAVEVPGFVPDLNGALHDATVFVAPLRFAAGVQNKVLEAMATATPVVTSPVVNEGLRATPQHDLVIAEGAEPTARAVLALLRDPALQRTLGCNGRRFVEFRFSWLHAARRMQEIERRLAT